MGKWAETEEAYFGRLDTQEGKSMEMREILFRGKRVIDGKWVESCCPLGEMHSGTVTYDFDSKTVCQYTGLTDKNGRKIFEGDILYGERYHDWGQGGEYLPDKCVIKWNDKRAAFDPFYWWKGYNHDLKNYEVIGNIYDNPNLL